MSLPRLTNENLRKDLIQTNYCEISIREGAFFIAFFSGGRWHRELQAKAFVSDEKVVHFPLLAMRKEVILLSRSCPLNSK